MTTKLQEQLQVSLGKAYSVERELGGDEMSRVFLATDTALNRRVVVKLLSPELSVEVSHERFRREISLAERLKHPHIVPLYDSGEAGALLWYVMPDVEGESLRQRLDREGQLPLEDALAIAREMAEALAYAHSLGFVHRDVKPENILLSGGHALLTDFGIAHAVEEPGSTGLTATGLAVGTPAYMSPEQAIADQVDSRSDVYSLGCVLYEMLAGEPPFTGPTASAILARKLTQPVPHLRLVREAVPEYVEQTITRALARSPGNRYTTATQFGEALSRPPEARVVNVNFAEREGRDVAANEPLVAEQEYHLCVSIGALAKQSVVRNPEIVRADLLPPTVGGHWLKIVAVSDDLIVSPVGHWLFLPTTGAAWNCDCARDGEHSCSPANRRSHLSISVVTPRAREQAELRLIVCHQRSVVQSLLVTATIAEAAAATGSNTAVVDYNLTESLTDMERVAARALSVMMNDSADGSHLLVFNGASDEVVPLRLSDGQMLVAVTMMRDVMRRIHIEDKGLPSKAQINRYDANNAKPLDEFVADVRLLAGHGWLLWSTLWGDRITYWNKHRDSFVAGSDVIQIARKERSTSVFPWALVYSIPIDSGAPEKNALCPLLSPSEWKRFTSAPGELPARCPFEKSHTTNVICPYGFWGFRYEIEQPVSLQVGQKRPPNIPVDPLPLEVVLGLSDELDADLLQAHLTVLEAQHPNFDFKPCHTRDEIHVGMGISDLELLYFYCHGLNTALPGTTSTTPSLGVGTKEIIEPPDFITWRMGWPSGHWQATRPLVFINGCHTADTVPQTLVNFVDTFSASLDAGGVIGTEITVHQLVANEVGQTFLAAFQKGLTVGQSLRQARAGLLRKGNLLGLVYTAYCSADLRLVREIE